MLASVPILMLSIYKLFMPNPEDVSAIYLLAWLVTLWLGWTMLFIPYYAWAAELSPEYNERSRITGWRSSIGLGANVLSKLVPAVAIYCCAFGGTQETLLLVGSMTLILLPLTVGLTVSMVPEGRDYIPARIPLLPGLRIMWRNGPFKRLIAAFFVNQLGTSISTALIVFYVRSVLQEDEKAIVQLLVFYAFNLSGIPFFVKYSASVGKHRAWCQALFLFSFFMLGYLLLGAGDFYWMLPITAVTGFLAGSFWVIPNSMKADVIDIDRLETGEDRNRLVLRRLVARHQGRAHRGAGDRPLAAVPHQLRSGFRDGCGRGFDAGAETPVRLRSCHRFSVDGVDCVELPSDGVTAPGTQAEVGSRPAEETDSRVGLTYRRRTTRRRSIVPLAARAGHP